MLAQLKSEFPNVYFLSLTLEEKDDRAKVEGWLAKAGASGLNVGKASESRFEALYKAAGERPSIPANVFVTPEGKVVEYMVGARGHDVMKRLVERISP